MAGIKGEQGKFVNKFKEETERISARIPKTQALQLRSMLEPGQNISELVREAIAYYLDCKK